MRKQYEVAVIGAGVVGLSASVYLQQQGLDVVCLEAGKPGDAQSRGLARIFRVVHDEPHMVELAQRAREGWWQWEQQSGLRLVGAEGLLVLGEERIERRSAALAAAGYEPQVLSAAAADAQEWLPLLRHPHKALLDPAAGVIRAARTISWLAQQLGEQLQHARVERVELSPEGEVVIHSSKGQLRAQRLLICAGTHTPALARGVGLELQQQLTRHHRFSFALSVSAPPNLSALITDELYGLPVGSTGLYALGPHMDASLDLPVEQVRAEALEAAQRYLARHLVGLERVAVDEVECLVPHADWMTEDDGFAAWIQGPVTAFMGSNLFKFAPLLGQSLAHSVTSGQLAAELRLDWAPSAPLVPSAPRSG